MRDMIQKLELFGKAYHNADFGIDAASRARIDTRVMQAVRAEHATSRGMGARLLHMTAAFRGLNMFVPAPVRAVLRPLGTLAVAFVVVLATLGTVAAFSGSLPGDRLYGVKLASERAYVSLTLNPQTKTQIELELARRRLDEAATIADSNFSDRDARLTLAFDQYTTHLSAAQTKLETLRHTDQTGAAAMAKIVDRKTTEYALRLGETDGEISALAHELVADALVATRDASFTAVTVLLEGQATGEVSLAEVRETVSEKLRELEGSIQLVAIRLTNIPGDEYPEIAAIGGPTQGALLLDLSEARELLARAKNFFAQGGYEAALTHYRDGVGLINQLEWGVGLYERVREARALEALDPSLETEATEAEAGDGAATAEDAPVEATDAAGSTPEVGATL